MYTSMLSVPGISDGYMANSKYWPRHGSPIRENIGLVYWLFFPAEKPPPHRHQVLASNPQPQLLGPVVLRPGVVEHGADNGYEGNVQHSHSQFLSVRPLRSLRIATNFCAACITSGQLAKPRRRSVSENEKRSLEKAHLPLAKRLSGQVWELLDKQT